MEESRDKYLKKLLILNEFLASQRRHLGVRANLVVDSKGRFSGANGSSRDISNELDRALLVRLRELADVVVTDAATAANEGYAPSKWAPIQVWSKSGQFRDVQEDGTLTLRKIDDLSKSIQDLMAKFDSILLETGPTLTKAISKTGSISQLKLTVVGCENFEQARSTALKTRDELGLFGLSNSEVSEVGQNHFFTFSR